MAATEKKAIAPVSSHRGKIKCIQKRNAIISPPISTPVLDRASDVAPLTGTAGVRRGRRTLGLGGQIFQYRDPEGSSFYGENIGQMVNSLLLLIRIAAALRPYEACIAQIRG